MNGPCERRPRSSLKVDFKEVYQLACRACLQPFYARAPCFVSSFFELVMSALFARRSRALHSHAQCRRPVRRAHHFAPLDVVSRAVSAERLQTARRALSRAARGL
eukprot:6179620-Pleurochrysis_carterae.AAC.1